MFKSFKDDELEFSTYLRPIMQEVIKELPQVECIGGNGDKNWEDTETWGFLHKVICNDQKMMTDRVNAH